LWPGQWRGHVRRAEGTPRLDPETNQSSSELREPPSDWMYCPRTSGVLRARPVDLATFRLACEKPAPYALRPACGRGCTHPAGLPGRCVGAVENTRRPRGP